MLAYSMIEHTKRSLVKEFILSGFYYAYSKNIVSISENFDFLRIGWSHISRSEKDSFYINKHSIFRTHSTSAQYSWFNSKDIKLKIKSPKSFSIFTTGWVFRRDDSSRHYHVFNQVDGVIIFKEGESVKEYKKYFIFLLELLTKILKIKMKDFRIRRSYFPFTLPSFEVDAFINGKYIEILGCGVIHPEIASESDIRPGFAFGLGIERIAGIRYKVDNIKILRWSSCQD